MKNFKPGDKIVCILKKWDTSKGLGAMVPKYNEIYTVRRTCHTSIYCTLMESDETIGYEKDGFEKVIEQSKFDKILKSILNINKKELYGHNK